jgi:hypothetical protein
MRRFGQLLMLLGLGLGGAVGFAILFRIAFPGASWLVMVGLAKLSLVAAGGLLAGGAMLQRLATRRDEHRMLPSVTPHPDER